jgi:hypothetical protein
MIGPLSLLGAVGMLAIETSYLPQIVRLARLKRADDVSYFFPALNLGGRLCALTYSVAMGSSIFGIGFLVGAMLRLTLLLQVIWYRRNRALSIASPSVSPAGAR